MLRGLQVGVLLLIVPLSALARAPRVRISAWYWLNAAPEVDWEGDFVTMRNLGFTDVVLCWGLDTAAFVNRKDDSRYALEAAHKAGIGAYILLWHPYANTLPRDPSDLQVDSAGKVLHTFDTFDVTWRDTEWKHFLQTVAATYGHMPAMSGYVFDDSFEIGGTGIVSYGAYERQKFGHELPRKPGDPYWQEWCDQRARWWEDWARDTHQFIREVDPNPDHLIYLEDVAGQILNPKLPETAGVDFPHVARHFDAVGGYTFSHWDASAESGQKVADQAAITLKELRRMLGRKEIIIYTFWVANDAKKGSGMAEYPTAEQIRLICEAALRSGVRYLDMYGFRIGSSGASDTDQARVLPGIGRTYPLSGQIPQTFLWDRPFILRQLGDYLRSLNGN
jgi:hypothetical protein